MGVYVVVKSATPMMKNVIIEHQVPRKEEMDCILNVHVHNAYVNDN